MSKKRATVWMAAVGLFGAMTLGAPSAYALGIDVAGFVDPVNASVTDNGDGTSTFDNLEYYFDVLSAPTSPLGTLAVSFETDVFDLSGMSLQGTLPADWTMAVDNSLLPTEVDLLFNAGTPVTTGGKFAFTLDGVKVENAALTDASYWDEGQVWGQAWVALGTDFTPLRPVFDGGSTTPVPEPATLLLMGSGLVGLAGWGRRRMNKGDDA